MNERGRKYFLKIKKKGREEWVGKGKQGKCGSRTDEIKVMKEIDETEKKEGMEELQEKKKEAEVFIAMFASSPSRWMHTLELPSLHQNQT